jgi:ketol-acid reductoisomerase
MFIKRLFSTATFKLSTVNLNGVSENVYNKMLFPVGICQHIFNPSISVIGYGSQGRAQSLNLKKNGYNVVVGLNPEGKSWKKAIADGWVPKETLFSIDEACQKGEMIKYLLSDQGQIEQWDSVKQYLSTGKTLYFSHGFGIVFKEQTRIDPPLDIDVIMVAPKASGVTLMNQPVNCSYAVYQNYSNIAEEKAIVSAFAIGCNNLFKTTFEQEVYSDLTGERSVLMGMILGAFKAQYDVLIANGHPKSEAWNETVEEALNSLYKFINEVGPEELINNCSYTARIGCLDYMTKFENVIKPVIEQCYKDVKRGKESERVISYFSGKDSMVDLQKKVDHVCEQDIWKVGKEMRKLR